MRDQFVAGANQPTVSRKDCQRQLAYAVVLLPHKTTYSRYDIMLSTEYEHMVLALRELKLDNTGVRGRRNRVKVSARV
ncbi:hypothetical protein GCM10011404_32080 [Sphingomonas prati]|nr:hypothetical protein GCM10011404_32080 [Sphingomonas prati]